MSHPPSGEYFGELTWWVGWAEGGDGGSGDMDMYRLMLIALYPQVGVVAVAKMWLAMELGLWPWTVSSMLVVLCVLPVGPSSGASTSMLWRGGHIVRAATW